MNTIILKDRLKRAFKRHVSELLHILAYTGVSLFILDAWVRYVRIMSEYWGY